MWEGESGDVTNVTQTIFSPTEFGAYPGTYPGMSSNKDVPLHNPTYSPTQSLVNRVVWFYA